MGLRWYVARTEPRAEFLAADELTGDGIEVFFPRVRDTRPRLGHSEIPLFQGYLFIRCDPQINGWPSFRRSHRIAGWVTFGGEVPSLPDEVVASLSERWEMIKQQGGHLKRFLPGDKIRIEAGAFQGLAEVVEEAKSPQGRAKVLLQFMGRLVEAHIPWENLKPAEDQPDEPIRPPRRTRGRGRWIQGFGSRGLSEA
jgi:transcriptional antiterminator RfaH